MKTKTFLVTIVLTLFNLSAQCQNNALTFDGSDDYLDLGTGITVGITFTQEMWLYPTENPTSGDFPGILGRQPSGEGPEDRSPCIFQTEKKIHFGLGNGTSWLSATTTNDVLTLNQWQHLAVTFDGTDYNIYINGVLQYTSDCASGSYSTSPIENIGRIHTKCWQGKLDEVRIWNDVRTTAEIRENMYSELSAPGSETNLVAYYKFNESDGASQVIDTKNSNTGTLANMNKNEWEPGAAMYGPQNCLDFDGSDDMVSIPYNSAFDINTTVTVEAWVNFTNVDAERPVVIKNGGAFYLYASPPGYAGKAGFFIEGVSSSWLVSTTSINDGVWHHIAGTYDGSTIKVYVDGIMENSVLGSGDATDSGQSITIGYRDGGYKFTGKIDEVRIWNIAREADDIPKNMYKQLTGNESGLIAYYNFNNGTGETLQDFSPNALDGTLTNMDKTTDWLESEAYNTWLNTTSVSWGDATNWSRGSIPDAADNVGIYTETGEAQPVADDNTECNNLIISTSDVFEFDHSSHRTIHGSVWNVFNTKIKDNTWLTITGSLYMLHNSKLEIDPTASLTIDKNLHTTFLGLDGTLTIKSDENGTGSLIVDGSSTGDVDFERYLSGSYNAWHMYSAPVNSVSIKESAFDPRTGTDNDFYLWYEPSPGIWVNFKNQDGSGGTPSFPGANGGNNNFVNGKGYLTAYNESNPTKTIAGDINTDAVNFTLKNSATKDWTYAEGWNLLGNPFSSAIDWSVAIDESGNHFQDVFAYAYDQSAGGSVGQYVEIDGSSSPAVIPSQQGFFVLAKQSSNDVAFTFTKNMKYHASNNTYKSLDQQYDIELLLTSENFFDNTAIRVTDNSTTNRDFYDALKLMSFNEKAPGIYSISENNVKLAVNSIPEISESTTIKLGIKIPETATYTISIRNINTLVITEDVYLEDKLENTSKNISTSDYTFSSFNGEFNDRFVIHFNPVGIEESKQEKILTFTNGKTLNLINNSRITGTYNIFNCGGSKVKSGILNGNTKQTIEMVYATSGIYVISIVTENETINSKITIL